MTPVYLGIDLGTSELKVVLVDSTQRLIATARSELGVQRPQPLWSEQQPADWWHAVEAALADLRRRAPQELAAVAAIGLSGQMHGAVLLYGQGRVLRPAILWNDLRSSAECVELERRAPELRRITGNLAMPGFTAPKLLWVARYEPEIFRHRESPAAEGLSAPPPDGRGRLGDVGRQRHPLARRRPARLVGRHAGGDGPRAPPYAPAGRGSRALRHAAARAGARLGPARRR
jgi:hypothetical protein